MATELAKAYIQIIPSAEGMQNKIESAITGDVGKAGSSAGKNFGSSFLKIGAGVIAAGAAAVGAAAAGVWNAANATAQAGDEIDKTSQKIGVSTEQYQAMAFAAEHCGFEVSTFQTAAKNLAKTDFEGNMADAVNQIMALGDVTERTAMAQELFGAKAAQSMAPLLNGTEDLEDYKNQLADIGGLMSEETVKASAAFEDSLTNLQTAFGGLKNGLMADFLPSITQVMDGLTMIMNGDEGGMALIKEGIDGFLGKLEETLPQMLEFGMELISSFCDVIIENLPEIIEMGIELIMKLIVGIVKAIPKLIEKMPDIIKAIVRGLKAGWPEMKEAGKNLIEGLWEGIKATTEWIKNKLKEWVGNITDFLKNLFGIQSPSKLMRDEIGKFIPQGIAVGIETNAGAVESAMSELTDLSVNAFDVSRMSTRSYSVAKDSNSIDGLVKALEAQQTNVTIKLEGDARKLFKAMQSESNSYKTMTGKSAFA